MYAVASSKTFTGGGLTVIEAILDVLTVVNNKEELELGTDVIGVDEIFFYDAGTVFVEAFIVVTGGLAGGFAGGFAGVT